MKKALTSKRAAANSTKKHTLRSSNRTQTLRSSAAATDDAIIKPANSGDVQAFHLFGAA